LTHFSFYFGNRFRTAIYFLLFALSYFASCIQTLFLAYKNCPHYINNIFFYQKSMQKSFALFPTFMTPFHCVYFSSSFAPSPLRHPANVRSARRWVVQGQLLSNQCDSILLQGVQKDAQAMAEHTLAVWEDGPVGPRAVPTPLHSDSRDHFFCVVDVVRVWSLPPGVVVYQNFSFVLLF